MGIVCEKMLRVGDDLCFINNLLQLWICPLERELVVTPTLHMFSQNPLHLSRVFQN
jgi:hypothetical protein